MDAKLQAAAEGLDAYRQVLAAIKTNVKAALEQCATGLCKLLGEIEAQYADQIEALRRETCGPAGCLPASVSDSNEIRFYRDRLCTDCGREGSAGTRRSIPTGERRRLSKLVGKPVRAAAAEP